MCLAIPGKIVKIDGDSAVISYGDEKRQAKIVEGKYSVGDYVLVQMQMIAKKLNKKEALEAIKEWDRS